VLQPAYPPRWRKAVLSGWLRNFRLLRRLLSQVDRILGINRLQAVTAAVVEAARESLVIGTA
jgi:hypothetical protein